MKKIFFVDMSPKQIEKSVKTSKIRSNFMFFSKKNIVFYFSKKLILQVDGRSALFTAIAKGDLATITALVDGGVDANQKRGDGKGVVEVCEEDGASEEVTAFLRSKVDAEGRGATPPEPAADEAPVEDAAPAQTEQTAATEAPPADESPVEEVAAEAPEEPQDQKEAPAEPEPVAADEPAPAEAACNDDVDNSSPKANDEKMDLSDIRARASKGPKRINTKL